MSFVSTSQVTLAIYNLSISIYLSLINLLSSFYIYQSYLSSIHWSAIYSAILLFFSKLSSDMQYFIISC